MNKRKWIATAGIVLTTLGLGVSIPNETVNAATYHSYSYWLKKDARSSKPRKVVTTKKIVIRKLKWKKSGVGHEYLSSKKTIKAGTSLTISANNTHNYAWAILGKYRNWVYPKHTANWFLSPSQYKKEQAKKKKAAAKKSNSYVASSVSLSNAGDNGATIKLDGLADINIIKIKDNLGDGILAEVVVTNLSNKKLPIRKLLDQNLTFTDDLGEAIHFDAYYNPNASIDAGMSNATIELQSVGDTPATDDVNSINIATKDGSQSISVNVGEAVDDTDTEYWGN